MKHQLEIKITVKSALFLGIVVGYNIGKLVAGNSKIIIIKQTKNDNAN